jgi:hypothetical protein
MITHTPLISRIIDCAICTAFIANLGLSAMVTPKSPLAKRDTIFYITPQIRHLNLLSPSSTALLQRIMRDLEPDGPHDQVQVGYTLTLPLYNYFEKKGNIWQFNRKHIAKILNQAARIQRPFVVYIAADHFFGDSPYGAYLASLPQSLMQFQDGSVPKETYFKTGLVPFRISNDEKLPHIHAKFEALRDIAQQLASFYKQHPELLVGITMNGETHYMFENFYAGTGNFKNPRYTDFSPDAIRDFTKYLTAKHLPHTQSSNIETLDFTTYPAGTYPFFGWYCAQSAEERVAIYHNGKRLDDARMHINRMDVYEAIPTLHNPNCGFRYDIDFSTWPQGTHRIEAILEVRGKRYSLDNNQLLLQVGKNDGLQPPAPQELSNISSIARRGYVDRGSQTPVHVAYAPIARYWMQFRADSIREHQEKMGDIFTKSGLPKELLYSYQLPAWMNGDWNDALFGIGEDFFASSSLHAGITLYGGNTLNPAIALAPAYGVPEFHPQMEHNPTIAEDALRYHYAHQARFVSPYFLNVGDHPYDKSNHYYMMIEPHNAHMGSDRLYSAIKNMAAY